MTELPIESVSEAKAGMRLWDYTLIEFIGKRGSVYHSWLCECKCGTRKIVGLYNILKGSTKSCGCHTKERLSKQQKTHGHTVNGKGSPEFNSWMAMKTRCAKETGSSKNYFHKGIKVCERWQNSFSAFYEDMGPRPSLQHSIDRIDSNGDYCLENCRWATSIEQNRNKSNNTIIEFNGENKTLAEWAEIYKLDRSTITSRIFKYGWSIKDALTTPAGYKNPAKYPNSKITYEKKS